MAVLMSIHPEHLINILSGIKTIELRHIKPNASFLVDYNENEQYVYFYCTQKAVSDNEKISFFKGNKKYDCTGKVCVRASFRRTLCFSNQEDIDNIADSIVKKTGITREEIKSYAGDKPLYGWELKNVVPFVPLSVSDFTCKTTNSTIKTPPQSLCYCYPIKIKPADTYQIGDKKYEFRQSNWGW